MIHFFLSFSHPVVSRSLQLNNSKLLCNTFSTVHEFQTFFFKFWCSNRTDEKSMTKLNFDMCTIWNMNVIIGFRYIYSNGIISGVAEGPNPKVSCNDECVFYWRRKKLSFSACCKPEEKNVKANVTNYTFVVSSAAYPPLCVVYYVPNVCQFHHHYIMPVLLVAICYHHCFAPILRAHIITHKFFSLRKHNEVENPCSLISSPIDSVVRFFTPSIEIPCWIHFIFQ